MTIISTLKLDPSFVKKKKKALQIEKDNDGKWMSTLNSTICQGLNNRFVHVSLRVFDFRPCILFYFFSNISLMCKSFLVFVSNVK
jgi:hypothetical protein